MVAFFLGFQSQCSWDQQYLWGKFWNNQDRSSSSLLQKNSESSFMQRFSTIKWILSGRTWKNTAIWRYPFLSYENYPFQTNCKNRQVSCRESNTDTKYRKPVLRSGEYLYCKTYFLPSYSLKMSAKIGKLTENSSKVKWLLSLLPVFWENFCQINANVIVLHSQINGFTKEVTKE